MSKKKTVFIIFVTVVLTVLVNIFFGRFLSAKISTLPLVNKFKILDPLAPIVITQRQEVRVSDTGDVLAALDSVKSKLSTIVLVQDKSVALLGGAINVTTDGLFVTSKNVIAANKLEDLRVQLEDGRTAKITSESPDPATSLVLLQADISNVPASNLTDSASVTAGQKIIFVAGSGVEHAPNFKNGYVSQTQGSNIFNVSNAGFPERAFIYQLAAQPTPGQAVADMSGQILGIWDGNALVSSAVMKNLIDGYLTSNHKIVRASYGFSFSLVSSLDQQLVDLPAGAKVIAVASPSAASKAGLLAGDVITQVGGDKISQTNQLEEVLQKYKPGDTIKLTISRGQTQTELTLIPGELK